jgi:putative holliday junction resolvase
MNLDAPKMRYLSIDFGLKRIGLAVSNPAGTMVFPLKTIVRGTRQAMFDELVRLIHEENIDAIVLGIPLGVQEEKNLTSRQVVNFKKSLERRVDIPVHTVNEAFTTSEAKVIIKKHKTREGKDKKSLDQVAAMLILETFLNQRGN